MPSKKNTACRYCGSTRLTPFLNLGNHPPSNSFLRPDEAHLEERYPLDVYFCGDCYLVQLLDVVSPQIIFGGEYLYLASSSKALKAHYADLANTLATRYNAAAGDVVVDIGCNDGILLHGYKREDLVKVGIEPSDVARIAAESGLTVIREFFSPSVAQKIAISAGKAKIVTATNVFPHVDDISSFTAGVCELLADDGVFVVEASYLIDLVDQTLFDTIYHEHLCYLSLTPMKPFFRRHGLEIFDVERVPFGASGSAFRVFAQKQSGKQPVRASVAEMLEEELRWGVGSIHRYLGYARQVETIKESVLSMVRLLRGFGRRVGAYGAPAKGNTLLNYLGLTAAEIECIAETNPLKQGLLAPGSHIPVVSEQEFIRRMPEFALLLTWNYLNFFLEKSEYVHAGGRFLVPLPVPGIRPPLEAAVSGQVTWT